MSDIERDVRELSLSSQDKKSDRVSLPAVSNDAEATKDASQDKVAKFVDIAEQRRTQLLCVARRMTNCREDAEDIVQYALLKAFANLSRFREESHMSTWLYMIVQNTARQWLRDRKGRICLSLEYGGNSEDGPMILDLPDPGRNPEEACEQTEMENIVHSELEGLNSVCTRALQLCFLDELSQMAAARAQNVSAVTIKSRVFRGKQMLKRALCKRTGGQTGNVSFSGLGSNAGKSAFNCFNDSATQ